MIPATSAEPRRDASGAVTSSEDAFLQSLQSVSRSGGLCMPALAPVAAHVVHTTASIPLAKHKRRHILAEEARLGLEQESNLTEDPARRLMPAFAILIRYTQ